MIALDQNFDSEFANRIARLESYNKHLYRPNTYLHKWWARRCGTTFRLILKQLIQNDPQRDFYAAGGLEGTIVLDPMMGGGTTLHEAIRLGANVIGVDVDPIPILQAQASLSSTSASDLEEPFRRLLEAITIDLGPFLEVECQKCEKKDPYPLRFVLYGLQRYCLCGPAIHVDSLVLRREGNNRVVRLCPDCHQVHDREGCHEKMATRLSPPIYDKTVKLCPVCSGSFREELDKPFYKRYKALITSGSCPEHGLFFREVTAPDLEYIQQANDRRDDFEFGSDLTVRAGPKSNDLLRRGIFSYKDLFSSRQLIYLHAAIRHLDNLDPLIRLPLALLISTSLEFNSMLCGYKGADKRRAGAIRHAFSHHAYSFPYTALENNPLYPSRASGTLTKLFYDRVVQAKRWAARPRERNITGKGQKFKVIEGEVDWGTEAGDPTQLRTGQRKYYLNQSSSVSLDLPDDSVDFVVTDPPYYDSVEYGDLSAFFRAWLRQLVGRLGEDKIDWDYDVPHFIGTGNGSDRNSTAYGHYINLMSQIFTESRRVLRKEKARLIFTFHHWKADSWAALTIALKRAGFVLISRYVVHSENPISVHVNNLRALTDDTILVLAPAVTNQMPEWPKLERISFASSAEFCADCGTNVGWLLCSELAEEEIRAFWHELLDRK